ncbi:extracellular solute-binding protein [Streptomyces armeniacus]|uniref:Probable sugar-binding periplasmic protein n=1 Tax=Streptomyces armeniacus TaxID=83291 RepID=A0A345XPE5_9ACTN|nr:extracellular solute-binding protein [Streptomyces armeniacus]AXK33511.1 extracellular solute-binding protein [Streptomyces armeniacus]
MTEHSRPYGLSRRGLLRAAAVGGTVATAAACAGPGTTRGGRSGAGAPSDVPKPVSGRADARISFAHWRAEDKKVLAELIGDFTARHRGSGVQQDISPAQDYQANALQRLKSGAVGDVLTAFRGAQFADMLKAGLFTELSAQTFADHYMPRHSRGGRDAAGRLFGLPYQLVFLMPLANGDLLEKAGYADPPQDWDGYLDLCDKLKSRGTVPLAWPGAEPGNAGQLFNSMVMNNAPHDDACARIESGKAKVTDDWFLRILGQYAQLRPFVQRKAAGTQVEPAQQMFARGSAAMLATGSYHMAAVRQLDAEFPIALVPPITVAKGERPRYVGTHNATFILGVNAASKHATTALRFVEYLSTPSVATRYANGTAQHLTVTGVTYENKDLRDTQHWLEKRTMLAPRYQIEDIDMLNAVEGACAKVLTGTSPGKAAEAAQRVVDQRRRK